MKHKDMDDEEISSVEVEDDASDDESGSPQFSITSYGADYTVDSLVKRMKAGSFKVPEFQRKFVWSQRHASKFIESLLMGLPVPGIFLYKQEDNKHLVIDGQQRLTSLRSFYVGTFGDKKFRLLGVRSPWTDKTYEELAGEDQLKLDDSIVHATIFQQEKPKDALKSIYYVFERINSGGISLSPQEIRNCVNQGDLLVLVRELNNHQNWRDIFGSESKRLKDQELILRFLAFYDPITPYSRPMAGYLNDYLASKEHLTKEQKENLSRAFCESIDLLHDSVGKKSFRPVSIFNAAVYDSVMIGMARRLDTKKKKPSFEDVRDAYKKLLANKDYRKSCERATADEESVAVRFRLATQAFEVL